MPAISVTDAKVFSIPGDRARRTLVVQSLSTSANRVWYSLHSQTQCVPGQTPYLDPGGSLILASDVTNAGPSAPIFFKCATGETGTIVY